MCLFTEVVLLCYSFLIVFVSVEGSAWACPLRLCQVWWVTVADRWVDTVTWVAMQAGEENSVILSQ